jgi:drug/metabolite transporter (DMT)-like permease
MQNTTPGDTMNQRRQTLTGYASLAAAAAIWGGMYVVSKYTLNFIPPLTLLWLRYLTGFAVLMYMVRRRDLGQPFSRDRRLFMTIGLVGYVVSVGLQFAGTRLSSASMGAILTSASPAFIVLFARFMLAEPLTVRKLLSVLVASCGVLTVVGWQSGSGPAGTALAGNVALVGAAVTWALLSVLAKKAATTYSPLVVTTYAIFWALIFTTPLMFIEWQYLPVTGLDRPLLWLAILYLGVVSTSGAFYLWNKGMHLVEASVGSVFFFLQPVVGSFFGWLLLHEKLGTSFFAGGTMILLAVLIVSFPGRRSP